MEKKLVGVILPVFNGGIFLEQAISSILNQSYTFFELIIVNDCSTDNPFKIIQSFAKKDERILVIQNQTNKKLSSTLNIVHKMAKGYFITWTPNYNILRSNFLKEQLKAKEKVDIVYSNYAIIDKNNRVKRTHKAVPTEYLLGSPC